MKRILFIMLILSAFISAESCFKGSESIDIEQTTFHNGEEIKSFEHILNYCIDGYEYIKIGSSTMQKMQERSYGGYAQPIHCSCR